MIFLRKMFENDTAHSLDLIVMTLRFDKSHMVYTALLVENNNFSFRKQNLKLSNFLGWKVVLIIISLYNFFFVITKNSLFVTDYGISILLS